MNSVGLKFGKGEAGIACLFHMSGASGGYTCWLGVTHELGVGAWRGGDTIAGSWNHPEVSSFSCLGIDDGCQLQSLPRGLSVWSLCVG